MRVEKDNFVADRPFHGFRQVLFPEDLIPGAVYIRHFSQMKDGQETQTSELVYFNGLRAAPGDISDLAYIQADRSFSPVSIHLIDLGLADNRAGLWAENGWLEYIPSKTK